MKKFVVYTAIFNNYDWLKEPVVFCDEIDYICFTDSVKAKSKHWKIVHIDVDGKSPSLLNREIKILYPYTVLREYEYSLYVDGSMMIKGNVNAFFNKYIVTCPIIMNFKHPNNDCIFEEIKLCIKRGSGDIDKLFDQYVAYNNDGMPKHFGLSDNKILLRNNHSEKGEKLMEEWYRHVANYSGRDQVCLSYVFYRNGMKYSFFDENIENNLYFETWPHNTVEWYIRYWRHLKWFLERHHFFGGLIKYVDYRIKPRLLKK